MNSSVSSSPAGGQGERVQWLLKLRKGRGLGRLEPPEGFPPDLFNVASWNDFRSLCGDVGLATDRGIAVDVARGSLGVVGGWYEPTLTLRRERMIAQYGVSMSTIQRLELEGMPMIDDALHNLLNPMWIAKKITTMNALLERAKTTLDSDFYSPEWIDDAQHCLMQVLASKVGIGGRRRSEG